MKAVNVTLRRGIAAAAALAAAPVLSSCLPGNFDAATDQIYTPAVGVNDRSGTVDVLNVMVVSGEDGTGTVVAGLVNNDTAEADQLTGISGAGEEQALTLQGSPVEIPADGLVQLVDDAPYQVTGEAIKAGYFVELTFDFESSASITVDAPVIARRGEYANVPVPDAS